MCAKNAEFVRVKFPFRNLKIKILKRKIHVGKNAEFWCVKFPFTNFKIKI